MSENLTKLINIAAEKGLEFRLHVNPQLAEEETFLIYLNSLSEDEKISNQIIAECLTSNKLISLVLFPTAGSEDNYYAHGTDAEECAEAILKQMKAI